MRRRAPHSALTVAAVLLLSACGSTAANTGDAALGNGQPGLGAAPGATAPGADGLGGTTGGEAPGAGTTGGTTGGFAGTSGGTTGGAVGGPGGSTGGAGTTSGGTNGSTSVATGPGITATTIAIGIAACKDCYQANAALGAGSGNEDPGDERNYYNAALADVNARGGVLGRKLVAVFHQISVSDPAEVSMQESCEAWTKDNKVIATYMRGEIVYECAKKAGAIAIGLGDGGNGPVYARYPNLFSPSGIRLERLGAATVRAMVRAGWQKAQAPTWPTGKIGLITWDNADYRYGMKYGYLAALHAAGLKEDDVRYVTVPQTDKSIGDANAAISSAVLSFHDKGIDHVFIQDGPAGIFGGIGLTTLFLSNAESQRYFPRYGFNVNNDPGNANYPKDEQAGMLAIDSSDIDETSDTGIPPNAARQRCFALMKKAGLGVGGNNTRTLAAGACQVAWFIEATLKRTRGGTTLPYLIAAAESIGTDLPAPSVYGLRLTAGQHDGAALFRSSAFDSACGCMKYTSKPYEP